MPAARRSWDDWVTEDMLFEKVAEIMSEMGSKQVLMLIPDVYSIVKEHLNNQALEELAAENDCCTQCGCELDDESCCLNCDGSAYDD